MKDQPDSSSAEPWEDQSDGSFKLKPRHDPAIDSHYSPLADNDTYFFRHRAFEQYTV